MTRNPCWYKILFLFLRRFQKWKQNRKKLQRVERGLFFFLSFFSFTQWRRETNSRWIQLNTLPLQSWSYKWWLKKGLFLFHTGALVVYKPHGYLWVQFYSFVLSFFLFPHETGGVCKCASAIRTLSGVVAFLFILVRCFWGRVAGITTTWTGSSN